MTQQQETKARIQYSSRDELDVAVIRYCQGRSRQDLHARIRLALNGFYGPFAVEEVETSEEEVRRQAMRSIRQLTTQILEIKEQFLPELLHPETTSNGQVGLGSLTATAACPAILKGQRNGAVASLPVNSSVSLKRIKPDETEPIWDAPMQSVSDTGPIDEQLREFLGDDAAIMAGLNPFINDLT